jgi:predicted AAA+ superfamily ATPase
LRKEEKVKEFNYIPGVFFETGIFSELVKKYGRENVFYWRTKDKKEIDFILKMKDAPHPHRGEAQLRAV